MLIWILYLFLIQQNRPLNSQNVADALQKFKLKKTAIQKALDTLSDSGQISFKEYGKQKIYLARQDQFNILNSEELDQMKKANSKLQAELEVQKKAIVEVEAGMSVFPSYGYDYSFRLRFCNSKYIFRISFLLFYCFIV